MKIWDHIISQRGIWDNYIYNNLIILNILYIYLCVYIKEKKLKNNKKYIKKKIKL